MLRSYLSFLFIGIFIPMQASPGYDWPMWRYDYHRSASTPEQLADQLYLQWKIHYSPRIPVWDDPLNQNLMQFDRIFEPIVAGDKVFIGFNDKDKVVALDLHTGKEIWHYYAEGPVRLPMAAHNKRLYFTGDDGYCYCLDASDGSLVWKRLLAPADKKLLGNKRLISMWPARGGVVIKDGIIYTAASIFPMMGTYIYALDVVTGDIIWKNEATGSNYILQPHRSPAFADVAPQGPFTISGDKLLVAGGRSVPAAFDLKTGKKIYYHLASAGKTGGAFTCSNDRVFFNHHRGRTTVMYDSENGEKLTPSGEYPVIDGNTFYFSGDNIYAASLDHERKMDTLWSFNVTATKDLIKAGNTLFAAGGEGIQAIRIKKNTEPELIWKFDTKENIERLIAANGKLIAVTEKGCIMVFGDAPVKKIQEYDVPVFEKSGYSHKILSTSGVNEGYSLMLGGMNVHKMERLVSSSDIHFIVYEKDPEKMNDLREYFDKKGVSANRICFMEFGNTFPSLPEYFSSLTIINDIACIEDAGKELLQKIYDVTRPYDGKIVITSKGAKKDKLLKRFQSADLPGARIYEENGLSLISKTGALPGASPWTHNNGNIANTVKSDDKLVKAPLGILWFGGNSNLDVLPRHGHGPGEQVIDGRLIIEGINCISARDVYTGRVLWKREFENLLDDNWLVYYDETYDEENPLETKYNQVHLPGANARGTNYIATSEYVYLIEGEVCRLIDMKTGKLANTFSIGKNTGQLAYIGVYEDLLILGNNFSDFPDLENDSAKIKKPKFVNYDITASNELVVLNRFTGKRLWSIEANYGFLHNAVIAGDGMVFCLDKFPQYLESKLRRRGLEAPEGSRLLYLDARSGKILHEERSDIFGSWLGYSSEYELLLQANRPSRDMIYGEQGDRMIAYNVRTKEKMWDRPLEYANPPIIHNDKIYTNGEGFSLLTGEALVETDPVTGEELKWEFKREYGCGMVAASEYLLTFRSASAGFVNLEAFEGTGSLGGWKPGCSTNLIAADGVLNSPDYTRTCQCAYQNQTSLALINMPWMSYWTNSNYKWNGKQIKRLGLNFGAPGDRSTDDDVLWFEYPFIAGPSPDIPVEIDTIRFLQVRKEPYSVISDRTPWISSSAISGIQSLKITLSEEKINQESYYTVKLYFAELEDKKPGERIFDIVIQGKKFREKLDIVKEAGQTDKEITKSFKGVKAAESLMVELVPLKDNTIISGIELIKEEKPEAIVSR